MGYTATLHAVEGALEKTMKNFKDDASDPHMTVKERTVTDAWNQLQSSVSIG